MTHYRIWLGGTTASLLGSQIMAFGLIWTAAGQGGALAGAALTAVNLPRVLFLLYGGALADRIGARRVMIASDVTMAVATATLGTAILFLGTPPWLLLAAALTIGLVDAFYLPSSGSMPRRLVPGPALPRAVSARQAAGQIAALAGPPVGGLTAATGGLATAAYLNTLTYLLMTAILIRLPHSLVTAPHPSPPGGPSRPSRDGTVTSRGPSRPSRDGTVTSRGPSRPSRDGTVTSRAPSRGLRRRVASDAGGWRVVCSDPLLRAALGLVAGAAAFLLPVAALLTPLLALDRGWDAGTGGALAGAIALGTVVVAVTVTATGTLPRPGVAAAAGLAVAASGVLALAATPAVRGSLVAAAVIGIGSGLFSTHVGPLVLAGSPATHLARVQSVLILAQSVPLLLTNNALGVLDDRFDTSVVLTVCSMLVLATAVAGWLSPVLRGASLESRPQSTEVPPPVEPLRDQQDREGPSPGPTGPPGQRT
jgi:MFS family permease